MLLLEGNEAVVAGVIDLAAEGSLRGITAALIKAPDPEIGKEIGVTGTVAATETAVVTEDAVVQGTDDSPSNVQQSISVYN